LKHYDDTKYFHFIFKNIPYSELKNKTLFMKINDYDRFKRHDPIGEIRTPLNNIDLGTTFREWKDLR
jgi:hypothetical protein